MYAYQLDIFSTSILSYSEREGYEMRLVFRLP